MEKGFWLSTENFFQLFTLSPFLGNELTQKLEMFLTDHFEEVYLAHRKRVFKTDFETAFRISKEKGQRNLFLFKP